jgi:undecaprenyl-diphosphatase
MSLTAFEHKRGGPASSASLRWSMYVSPTIVRPIEAGNPIAAPARSFFASLDRQELRLVQRWVRHARHRHLIPVARIVTRAGNGWLYLIASALLLLSFHSAARCIAAALTSLAVAFTVYPPLKRAISRKRPCQRDALLADQLAPLDRHSFPSGHAMTAAAFGVPILFAAPAAAAPIVIAGWAAMCWSRIALGHHYLSDIISGTILGGVIAAAVATLLF